MCKEKYLILWLLFFCEISPKEEKDSVLKITGNPVCKWESMK